MKTIMLTQKNEDRLKGRKAKIISLHPGDAYIGGPFEKVLLESIIEIRGNLGDIIVNGKLCCLRVDVTRGPKIKLYKKIWRPFRLLQKIG